MKWFTASMGATMLFGIVAAPMMAQQQTSEGSQQQPGFQTSESIIRKATVQDIDYDNRTVTLKGEQGNVLTIQVGEDVKNFNNIKKGDRVTAQYKELMAVGIRKSNEPPSAKEQESLTTARPGEKPSGTRTETVQMSATVQSIDRDKREVTLRGPGGETRQLKVGKDVKGFDNLKEGDQVVATYTKEFSIVVTAPEE